MASSAPIGVLQLLRPGNLVTAAADILAGGLICGGSTQVVLRLVISSVCLYAGGVTLNDFFDRKIDAIERPERPLPSRRVPPWVASVLGAALLLVGVAAAFTASSTAGIIALLIALDVLFYNAIAKPTVGAPLVMGSCRALNLLLGLAAVPASVSAHWMLAFLPLVYICAITTLSRGEVHGGSRNVALSVFAALATVAASLVAIPLAFSGHTLSVLPFVLLLALRTLPPVWKVSVAPRAELVRGAVHAGIVSLITVDAGLAAGFAGFMPAAALLSLSILAAELARFFSVT